MAIRFSLPYISTLDANGNPVSGSKANFYESGTTTPLDTYSDENLTSVNANPVVADSAGKFGDIWLKQQAYKVIITDSDDVVLTTMDPVNGSLAVSGDKFKVSPQDPADMTVSVGAGTLFNLVSKAIVTKAAQTSATIAAPSANPRHDIVYADRLTGVIGIDTGAEGASPADPTISDDKVPLARITLATTTTEIGDSLITDIRELANIGTGSVATLNLNADGGITLTDTDAGAVEGPILKLYRNSATPSASDSIGTLLYAGEDDAGAEETYGEIRGKILDTAAASTDFAFRFLARIAGTLNDALTLGPGAQIGAPTGGDKGAGTLNAENGLYHNGTQIILLSLETPQATTSGTVKDFTGIASTVKRITVQFVGVSTDGTNEVMVQIGGSGGFETTGYLGGTGKSKVGEVGGINFTTGFKVEYAGASSNVIHGSLVLTLHNSSTNTWVASGVVGYSNVGEVDMIGGSKSLSAVLTQVRITTSGTPDDFDAGSVNIMVE